MRVLIVVALFATLAGCAASKQEVAARLGDQFVGQDVDALLVRLGPPTKTFKMNSGETLYGWRLVDRDTSHYCKVNAVVSKASIVTRLDTDDSNAGRGIVGTLGGYGSVCARHLGIKHQG
jgi:hypothetical protein